MMSKVTKPHLDYIWLTLGHHHYVADNGVRDVVSRLVSAVKQIHLSSPISAVEVDSQDPNLISLHCDAADGTRIHSGFHHLIFATEAKRAAPPPDFLRRFPFPAPKYPTACGRKPNTLPEAIHVRTHDSDQPHRRCAATRRPKRQTRSEPHLHGSFRGLIHTHSPHISRLGRQRVAPMRSSVLHDGHAHHSAA